MRWLARIFLCGVLFLAPLKFGIAVNNGEIAFFPLSWLEWLLTPWPPFLLPVLAGLALIAVALAYRPPAFWRRDLALPAGWLGLTLAAAIGCLHSTEHEYALLFVWHLLGATTLAVACLWATRAECQLAIWALAAVVVGAALAAFEGWQQVHGGGYAATLEYVRQMAEQGGSMTSEIIGRLERGRASGPFVYPNSFAAHLLLVGPLALALAWRTGGHFSPAWLSRLLFLGAATGLFGGALLLTGSRAAIVALGGAGCLAALAWAAHAWKAGGHRRPLWPALLAAGLILAIAGGGLVAVNRGRSLSSLGSRGHYYLAAGRMFAQRPLLGVGLGEFFPWYMRLKPPGAEETRIPHSILMLFASQGGLLGLLALAGWTTANALAIGRQLPQAVKSPPKSKPAQAAVPPRQKDAGASPAGQQSPPLAASSPASPLDGLLVGAVALGATAWLLHALVDFNMQIPGTVGTVAALAGLFAGVSPPPGDRPPLALPPVAAYALAVLLGVLAFAGLWRLPGERVYQQFYQASQTPDNDWEDCRRLAELARRRLPFSPYPDIVLAKLATARNQPHVASIALQQALERTPHRGSLWYALCHLHLANRRFEAARQAYQQAILWHPHAEPRQELDRLFAPRP